MELKNTRERILIWLAIMSAVMASCSSPDKPTQDGEASTSQRQTYRNPILSGFYPDPSICRVGEDFYLTSSTFSYFPGLPIFHSKDLVNWTQIGNILDRPEQLPLDGLALASQGLYAPTLRHHQGTFYLICTLTGKTGNFVVTAQDPAGPWSVPKPLPHVNGIDPDLFFDDDGQAYVTACTDPDSLLYRGHRTIRLYDFDHKNLTTSESSVTLVDGGTDIAKQPIWCEAPHLYKKDGWYYLFCAEGGTSIDHSEVVFRSKTLKTVFTPAPRNPILTQRDLPLGRENAITNAGHVDYVVLPNGEWWGVFLACRPYEENHFNTGRETFLLPMSWNEDGWPMMLEAGSLMPMEAPAPPLPEQPKPPYPHNGDFTQRDEFSTAKLPPYWMHIRTPEEPYYELDAPGLLLKAQPYRLDGDRPAATLMRRQQHRNFKAETTLRYEPGAKDDCAGLTVFQNETHHFLLAKTKEAEASSIVLWKSSENGYEEIARSQPLTTETCRLLAVCENDSLSFHFAEGSDGGEWNELSAGHDARYLSTETAGGFVGVTIGLYAYGAQGGEARFDYFDYEGWD